MKKVPVKAIFLKRNEKYGIDNKLLKYKDILNEDSIYDTAKERHLIIKIDSDVEEHSMSACDEESKDSMGKELNDTLEKNMSDTLSTTKTRGIIDDKSSQSASTRSENSYKNFKNKIQMMKKRSSNILKKVKIGFFISLLFNITLYSIIFAFLENSSIEYSSNTDTLATLGKMRYDLINVAYLTQKLYEIDSGFQLSQSREEIIDQLTVISDDLKAYTNDLQASDLHENLDESIKFKKFLWWFYLDDKFTEGNLNIIDSSNHVNNLINNIITEEPLKYYPYFIEIYRNTPSEVNNHLNNTSIFYQQEYKTYVSEHMSEIMIIFNALVNAKFLAKIILILYIFTILNNIRKRIFVTLLSGNKVNLSIALVKIRDRLIFLHNEDSSNLDIDERSKIKSKLSYKQHRYQKIVYVLIVIVASLMAFIIIFPNILTAPNLIKILDKEVSYMYLNNELRSLILHAFLNARDEGMPISSTLSNQYFSDEAIEVRNYLKEIDYASKLSFESVEISGHIEDIYIGSNDIESCLNTGIYEYIFLLRNLESFSDSVSIINYLETHEEYMHSIVSSLEDIEGYIKEDSDNLMTTELSNIFKIIMLMIFMQGLVLFIGFFPLLTKFQKVLNDEIEILLYLPREDFASFNSKSDI